jgi:lipid-A-disaccharide synthase-like uncharacterized protein
MSSHTVWLTIGFLGQAFFSARFLLQWVASERIGTSVVPAAFWWLSLIGGGTLLAYAISKRDPVIVTGQAVGLLIYARNLVLLSGAERREAVGKAER